MRSQMGQLQALIKMLMAEKGISQNQMAITLGIERASISRYLSGQTDINSSSLIRILKYLEIDIEKSIRNEIGEITGLQNPSLGKDLELLLRSMPQTLAENLIRIIELYIRKPSRASTATAIFRVREAANNWTMEKRRRA